MILPSPGGLRSLINAYPALKRGASTFRRGMRDWYRETACHRHMLRMKATAAGGRRRMSPVDAGPRRWDTLRAKVRDREATGWDRVNKRRSLSFIVWAGRRELCE